MPVNLEELLDKTVRAVEHHQTAVLGTALVQVGNALQAVEAFSVLRLATSQYTRTRLILQMSLKSTHSMCSHRPPSVTSVRPGKNRLAASIEVVSSSVPQNCAKAPNTPGSVRGPHN